MEIRIQFIGFENIKLNLMRMLALWPEKVARGLNQAAHNILIPEIRENLDRNKSIYTKSLYKSITSRTITVNVGEVQIGVGSFDILYAGAVEAGQPAHVPDFARIKDWLHVKEGLEEPALTAKAMAVVNSISRLGTVPHPFLYPAFQHKEKEFVAEFVQIMQAQGLL